MNLIIRDACPDDAPFLAKCIMAGMHFYDFETELPDEKGIYERLIACEERGDTLYSFAHTRLAELDSISVGSLLSYPGDIYRDLRHKAFTELWPELTEMEATSDQETGPGEYYLDSLAVLPAYRGHGIGRSLVKDTINIGLNLGFKKITLVADSQMPHLINLYQSLGFVPDDHRHVFGVDFQRMIYTP